MYFFGKTQIKIKANISNMDIDWIGKHQLLYSRTQTKQSLQYIFVRKRNSE